MTKRLFAAALAWCFAATPIMYAQATRPVPVQPNQQQAQLTITVIDQTGASIPTAHVRVTVASANPVEGNVSERGQITLGGLPVGPVQLHVEADGFAPADRALTLRRGGNNQTITLAIAGLQEEVVVSDAGADDTRGNAQTTTLNEDDIAELSDDPDELQAQLEALTGGAGAVFQVNGFRGGRLPSKDEIRQIRFRTNSFSADNHDAGRVQVEIITRPGLTAWSGNANVGLRTDVLNARNAFSRTETPEQFRRFNGGIRGPLIRNKTSLRINVDGNRSFDSGTIVALTPEGRIGDVVKRPFDSTNATVGIEHGFSANQTLRLEYRQSEDNRRNLGVGDFSLLERAYSRISSEQQFRASVQTILGRSSLNEFRLQYNHQDNESVSLSTEPAVIVIDAFSRGGAGVSSQGSTRTFEVTDNFDFAVGRQAMRVGVLLEAGRYRNADQRNAAGTFTFGSLDQFLAGTPNTFTQRLGSLETAFSLYQVGVYWQDDFRVSRSLSMSVGLREEAQTHLGDAMNVMPRFGFTFARPRTRTTIRGGYGVFHDWFDSNLYDQTLRVTGTATGQRDILILNPGYPDPAGGVASTVLGSGRVQSDPDLRLPYVHQASIGIERQLAPNMLLNAFYARMRGRNQLRSRNVNAPDEFGIRPEPGVGTVTQIESTGRSATDRLNVGFNYRVPQTRMFINANYTWSMVRNHADNPLSLPADSRNPDAEWGPSSQDVRHRINAMFNFGLPFGLRSNVSGSAQSAAPYTITTGRDDNRDGVSNDRPAGGGRNSARGAPRYEMNVRLTRAFGFGSRANQQGGGPGPGVVIAVAPDGGAQGPPPGGGGPVIAGGPPGAGNDRFSLEVYVQAFNVLNRTNFLNFSGNQLSPFFANPTSAAQARRIEVGMQFRF